MRDKILVPLDGSKPADVGLIAISAHRQSGVGRWAYGSVAEKVLRDATCPVLLIRVWRDEL